MPRFSIIIPVYNRIDEVRDLMDSLALQSCKDFEVVIVEDGSSAPCKDVVEEYSGKVNVSYYYKENEADIPCTVFCKLIVIEIFYILTVYNDLTGSYAVKSA